MKISCGISQTGNVTEAIEKIDRPKLIMFMTTEHQFSVHAKEIHNFYPDIPSIGCIGMSYENTTINENGITIYGYWEDVEVRANIIEQVSIMPIKYIRRLENDLDFIHAESQNTVCIDICCGHDEIAITTLNAALSLKNIPLIGGTGGSSKVAFNGIIYEDACVYALIKNTSGKIKTYKENLYCQSPEHPIFTVTNADPKQNVLIDLDGKPAKSVYQSVLDISEEAILTQTFKNPFGKICGDDVFIISIKEIVDNHGLGCFRRTTTSDVLTILQLDDYKAVTLKTLETIRKDFNHISCIFSVNCLFRYLLFQDLDYATTYFKEMSKLGTHIGFIGYGEHFHQQHTNQTFTCVVFE